ncbi:uncharacterized protein N7477_007395 [Penicillium maclennaniae]|uniref:uncharacterized protein n=1 Tax=Penicillium maclennaniae TaxID=1343394 RepID=UPI00253FF69A|nr:uncharacterized protein N7477_007395 [Penicillium maclennaniae]KAJ5664947.1 hypothetical protein N7477_007395 [Penicillium maclennaniae]
MESFPGTGDDVHGSVPDASRTTLASPIQPEPVSGQTISRSSPLLQNRSSLPPRAHPGGRHAKRLTLNFPINVPLDQPPSATDPTFDSSVPATPGAPIPLDVDDDGIDFLRAIALQERRVMELREELSRAETDLSTLKKQWAQSEKSRKRTEISLHAEPLLPLRSPDLNAPEASSPHRREQSVSSVGSSSVSQERISRELDRRSIIRPTLAKGTTISANGRRVFQGSHTRTLSLLSPVTAQSPSLGGPGSSEAERVGRARGQLHCRLLSVTMPLWQRTLPPPSREALMRTGKQMASDLREGLWTFFEDIRQATVGEEGINATESRTMSQSSSLTPSNSRKRDSLAKSQSRDRLSAAGSDTKPVDISSSFWHEFGVDSPAQTSTGAHRSPSDNTIAATTPRRANESERTNHHSSSPAAEDDTADNWDLRDTPLPTSKMTHTPSSSRSTVESLKHDQSPGTQSSSPRTSASFGEWNPSSAAPDPSVTEGIPWPTITKLAPSKLQRTASNLMAEWERSLSPSPDRKDSSSSSSRSKSSKKD